jgi:hypothetical protein
MLESIEHSNDIATPIKCGKSLKRLPYFRPIEGFCFKK